MRLQKDSCARNASDQRDNNSRPSGRPDPYAEVKRAFTRLDLVMMVAVFTLLAGLCLPAIGRSRQPAHHLVCANNLRQLGQALLMFSAENGDLFPPRDSVTPWPGRLFPYYGSSNVLRCPEDGPYPATFGRPGGHPANNAPRSYIFNGFSDYFQGYSPNGAAMPARGIKLPAQTIVFGEKVTQSVHFWLDYTAGDDLAELEQGRHFRSLQDPQSGGANYTFADGSVRFLKFGRSLWPTNLWMVSDEWRTIGLGL